MQFYSLNSFYAVLFKQENARITNCHDAALGGATDL